jgi:hypothetical protein
MGGLVLAVGVQLGRMGREWEDYELKAKKMVCVLCFYFLLVCCVDLNFWELNILVDFCRGSRTHRQQDGAAQPPASRIHLTYVPPVPLPRSSYSKYKQYFKEPAYNELLPPPLPAPHGKPYTLLLSIDDLLVTSTWDVRSPFHLVLVNERFLNLVLNSASMDGEPQNAPE